MNKRAEKEEFTLKRRKLYIAAVLVGTVIFLALFNLGSWFFVTQMKRYFDDELGKRLTAAAGLAARLVEVDIDDILGFGPDEVNPFSDAELRAWAGVTLENIEKSVELQGGYLIDDTYTVLVSSGAILSMGDKLSYVREDSLLFERAWSGEVTVSPLHVVAGNRFKTAYAPIHTAGGKTAAVVVLEANAEFFQLLQQFNNGRLIVFTASAGLLVLLSIFLYWAVSLFLRTETSLRRAEYLASMGQMAATVAHEIRNPLGIINSTADVLKQRYNNAEKHDELFDFIPAEIHRLNGLVNDFLVLSREPQLNFTESKIQDTVKKAKTAIQPEYDAAGISLECEYDEALPPFAFDSEAVYQILLNVLFNALQASAAGSTVRIRAKEEKFTITVEITDSGSGIEGHIDKVFEPFYTTKAAGSGLGLAVTRKIVESHGGSIRIDSERGVGTSVTIALPKRKEEKQ